MLLCLASLKGSPGVTTACLALAALWPEPWQRVLVEADPAGGDLAARYRLPVAPGLVSLAAIARRSTSFDLVTEHAQLLPGGLPVVVGPTGSEQAHATLAAITSADGRAGVLGSFAGRRDVVAVVDCGRLDPDSPAAGIVSVADQLLILARPHADQLAHVADRVLGVTHVVFGAAHTRLLLAGCGYPPSEVEREVGLTVAGTIPWDPRTAEALSGQTTARPRTGARLLRAVTRLAAELARDPRRLALDRSGEDTSSDADRTGRSAGLGWPATVAPNGAGPRRSSRL